MRVLLFGATGMVGKGVLLECLEDPEVESVLVLGRGSAGVEHPKLQELIHEDFFDYSGVEDEFGELDACFFCLGISSAGMKQEDYHRVTCELTLRAAETLLRRCPKLTFCYVSAAGADSTESGRVMWARVRGRTENRLLELGFGAAYMFRPGYIQPVKGVRSKTRWVQTLYSVLGPLYPVWRTLGPGLVTTTEKIGRAMIRVARDGASKPILETRDINALAE